MWGGGLLASRTSRLHRSQLARLFLRSARLCSPMETSTRSRLTPKPSRMRLVDRTFEVSPTPTHVILSTMLMDGDVSV